METIEETLKYIGNNFGVWFTTLMAFVGTYGTTFIVKLTQLVCNCKQYKIEIAKKQKQIDNLKDETKTLTLTMKDMQVKLDEQHSLILSLSAIVEKGTYNPTLKAEVNALIKDNNEDDTIVVIEGDN
jgi:hypothetical protein